MSLVRAIDRRSVARTVLAPAELTALLGAPVFLARLARLRATEAP